MFQFTRFAFYIYVFNVKYFKKKWVSPFGNPRIKRCWRFPVAYRSLLRPSSPLNAKASTKRPFHTLLNSQTFFIQKRVNITLTKYKFVGYIYFYTLFQKNSILSNRTENRCRRDERAYSRANGSSGSYLIIMRRFCLFLWPERIDILSTAVREAIEKLLAGHSCHPGCR